MSNNLLDEAKGKPSCIAVIICNEIIEDKATNNKTLVSLFNGIQVVNLPSIFPRMFIMASLTNGMGEWPLCIAIRSPSGKELLRTEGSMNFVDPKLVLDVVIEVRGLPLEEEGSYFVDVVVDEGVPVYRCFAVQVLKETTE